jgi:hypothetical protein
LVPFNVRPKFHRALETGSLVLAELSARECGVLGLDELLRLTALVALHDRDRDRDEPWARRPTVPDHFDRWSRPWT